ncbi:MAG: CDP-diacylglycerol--glycerol-3-phosphate 3-phosphatidyltransferase, partial [Verrucomicrobiota bacterium]
VVLAAEGFGKHKTISQMTTILAILVTLSLPQWGVAGDYTFGLPVAGRPWVAWVGEISKWATVALTLLSGGVYLWRNRAVYLHDV